jgi:MinD-like ATPase involved in chromosome partitioning or flagellar assembly
LFPEEIVIPVFFVMALMIEKILDRRVKKLRFLKPSISWSLCFAIFSASFPSVCGKLVSSHVFSNHKGGCGKTTTLFHSCGEYAVRHPDEKVLVIDTTLRGDLSELLFGGDKGAAGKQTLRAVASLRSTTRLLMQAAAVSAAADATVQAGSNLEELIKKLFPKERGADGVACLFDIEDQIVHVHDFNPAIPDNLYLCPGGSGPQTSYPALQRSGIAKTIRKVMRPTIKDFTT